MIALTRAQRRALKAVYDRGPLTTRGTMLLTYDRQADYPNSPLSYLQFRRHLRLHPFADCIFIPWHGMWLGIEPDGYTHS